MLLVTLLAISFKYRRTWYRIILWYQKYLYTIFTKINTAFRKYFFMAVFYIIRKSHKIIFQCRNCKYIRYYIIAFYGNMVLLSKYSKKQCQNSMKMLRNPSYCDKDNSFHIDAKEGLCLGFILSIDSMGAGIAAGAAQICIILLPFLQQYFKYYF